MLIASRKFFEKGLGLEREVLTSTHSAATLDTVYYLCSVKHTQETLDLATDVAKLRLTLQRHNTQGHSRYRMGSKEEDLNVDFLGVLGELSAHQVFSSLPDTEFAPLLDYKGQPGPDFTIGAECWGGSNGLVSVKATDKPGRICCNEEARLKAPTDLVVGVYFNPATLVADLYAAGAGLLLLQPLIPGKYDAKRAYRMIKLPYVQ